MGWFLQQSGNIVIATNFMGIGIPVSTAENKTKIATVSTSYSGLSSSVYEIYA